jgi:hypothetical protein
MCAYWAKQPCARAGPRCGIAGAATLVPTLNVDALQDSAHVLIAPVTPRFKSEMSLLYIFFNYYLQQYIPL